MNNDYTPLEAFDSIKNIYILADRGNGDFLPEWLREKLLTPIETILKNEDLEKFNLIQQVRELKDDVASLESCNSKLWLENEEHKKALKEIIVLYNEWLEHQKNNFEFFTLLNEIVCKYNLKEVIENE